MKRFILRAFSAFLACSITFSTFLSVGAAPSDEIEDALAQLRSESEALENERREIEENLSEVSAQVSDYVEVKLQIDRELELKRQEIENYEAQIHQYNRLIAEKQAELDELTEEQTAMTERYKLRMRAMQERGSVSFWSVLLSSDDFTEFLTGQAMIEEISHADLKMLSELSQSASAVLAAKEALAEKKVALAQLGEQLTQSRAELAERREETDALLSELATDRDKLREAALKAEQEVAELDAQIAKKENELNEARRNEQTTPDDPDATDSPTPPSATESGFLFPVDRSGYVCVTDDYTYRTNPITGNYQFHNGVDLAAYLGTPIYAAKSGTVTTAASGYGWGNYVVINHGDGFSTLYAHQDYYIVSEGEYVSQGQVIGYVGSTGNSTGPHLHFTIYYNGATVNPHSYIAIP